MSKRIPIDILKECFTVLRNFRILGAKSFLSCGLKFGHQDKNVSEHYQLFFSCLLLFARNAWFLFEEKEEKHWTGPERPLTGFARILRRKKWGLSAPKRAGVEIYEL